jgi:hypothetical protein
MLRIARGLRSPAAERPTDLKTTFARFLALTPGLALAAIYGRVTGDIANATAVIALLVGMWFGLQIGRGGTRTESES